MVNLTIKLSYKEQLALWRLAREQRREVEQQAAWIIRKQLENLGLLETDKEKEVIAI